MKNIYYFIFAVLTFTMLTSLWADELEIGEVEIEPGITLIFEGASADRIKPRAQNLLKRKSDIHLEVRANWTTDDVPPGTPGDGFVAYLNIFAEITNERTGDVSHVGIIPHINLIDNLHYARNIALPGGPNDSYKIKFFINPPDKFALATHEDWRQNFGAKLIRSHVFTFTGVDFSEILE